MATARPVAIDLFSGAGGLTLGFEQAGFDVLVSVEYDAVHAAVHSFNFPLTKTLCADLSKTETDRVREAAREGWERHQRRGAWTGEIDLVFGGPPCQGFSFIGKRLVDDHRNQLVFHFFRMVSELRPRYFVMENVPGMFARGHGTILNQLVREFEGAGYRVLLPVRILNASDYGVPQDRRRLFLLGARLDEPLPNYPDITVRSAPKRATRKTESDVDLFLPSGPTVKDAIGDLPDLDCFEELLVTDELPLSVAQMRAMEAAATTYARRLREMEKDPANFAHRRSWDRRVLTSSMRTVHTSLSIDRFRETKPGDTEPISRFYRLDPGGLCNTLRAGTGSERGAYTSPRPIHPWLSRVISVREAARLHSFPDWFRLHRTKWHGFRQVGNAVPPLLAQAVGQMIIVALAVRPERPRRTIEMGSTELVGLSMAEGVDRLSADPRQVPPPRRRGAVADEATA